MGKLSLLFKKNEKYEKKIVNDFFSGKLYMSLLNLRSLKKKKFVNNKKLEWFPISKDLSFKIT